jgi:hypothetical protein
MKQRVPKKHIATILKLSHDIGPCPRYVLAKALSSMIDVQLSTALDYILAATHENILQSIGQNISERHQK